MIISTEAIILKSRKFRDSSKLIVLYSEECGKVSVVANGARRAKNKFGSALEPLSCSSVSLYKYPNKDLHTLSQAEVSVPLRNLGESFERLTVGISILESIINTQLDDEKNLQIYNLLKNSLLALNSAEKNEETLYFVFQVRLAEIMGFALHPSHCPLSQEEVVPMQADEFTLSLADGAPFSPAFGEHRSGFRMDSETLAILQRLVLIPIEKAVEIMLSAQQSAQLQDFLASYFQLHLEKRIAFRTQRFLRELS